MKTLLKLAVLFALGMACGAASAQCVAASQVTVVGTLRASNGLPSVNNSITLTPSQVGIIAGCGVNTMATTSCATSVDGSVVQTGNPLVATLTSTTGTGTLPSGTYYVVYAWYDALGHITLASPETVQQLSAQGSLVVSSPAGGVPATAVGMKVFIGTSSGTETLQGATTGAASFNQAVPLVSGAALPGANNTACVATANDSMWPVGTGYVVTMEDSSGNALPGYPMQWQLDGAGTTINLSNGLPYYHGVVFYPTPILSAPPAHVTQSISGSLNLGGYNLLNIGNIGVGTALPAWPVDVENGPINASGGYIYNGGVGVSTGQCLVAGSDPFHIYAPGACSPTPPTVFYQTVQANGTPLTQQPVLNFDTTLSAANGSGKSTVGLPNVGTPGTYANPASITIDAQGRIPSVTPSSAINRVCSGTPGAAGYSCYIVLADGTTFEWGISNAISPGGGNLSASTAISFPHTFTAVPVVTLTADSCPNASDCSASAQSNIAINQVPGTLTTSGISAYTGTSAVVGGGGASIVSTVHIHWSAFGF